MGLVFGYGYIGVLPKFMCMMDVALGTLPCENVRVGGWYCILIILYVCCNLYELPWYEVNREFDVGCCYCVRDQSRSLQFSLRRARLA